MVVAFGASEVIPQSVSATQITVNSPAGTGTVNVTVSTPAGTSANNGTNDDFTYVPAPTITSMSRQAGRANNTHTVTITGTNFTGATKVTFGTSEVTPQSVSATQVVAIAPALSAGTVNVSVTTPAGTSADAGTADDFTYAAPPTATLEFSKTAVAVGEEFRLQGRITNPNPVALTQVSISIDRIPGSFSVVSGGACGASGTLNIDVYNAGGAITIPANSGCDIDIVMSSNAPRTAEVRLLQVFSAEASSPSTLLSNSITIYDAPTVTSVSPDNGIQAGNTEITITGTNFTGATKVTIGADDVLAANFVSITPTQIKVRTPGGTGGETVNVSVTTPGGTSADAGTADNFVYMAPPTVTGSFVETSVAEDSDVTYELTLTNPNPVTIQNVTAGIQLPSGLSGNTRNGCNATNIGAPDLATVTGASIVSTCKITFTFRADEPGTYQPTIKFVTSGNAPDGTGGLTTNELNGHRPSHHQLHQPCFRAAGRRYTGYHYRYESDRRHQGKLRNLRCSSWIYQ